VELIEFDKFLSILLYLFTSEVKSLPCPINQLLTVRPPSTQLKPHILETNSQCTPELLICALGDLTISNLTYTAGLLEYIVYFFFYLSSSFQGLLVLGCCTSPYVTISVRRVAPHIRN